MMLRFHTLLCQAPPSVNYFINQLGVQLLLPQSPVVVKAGTSPGHADTNTNVKDNMDVEVKWCMASRLDNIEEQVGQQRPEGPTLPPSAPKVGPMEISSTMIVAPIVAWIIGTAVDSVCATYTPPPHLLKLIPHPLPLCHPFPHLPFHLWVLHPWLPPDSPLSNFTGTPGDGEL